MTSNTHPLRPSRISHRALGGRATPGSSDAEGGEEKKAEGNKCGTSHIVATRTPSMVGRRRRLPPRWPAAPLLLLVSSTLSDHIIFISPAALLVCPISILRRPPPPTPHPRAAFSSSSSDDVTSPHDADWAVLPSLLCDDPALRRLNLTADEFEAIETRVNGITPKKRRQEMKYNDGDDRLNNKREIGGSNAGRSQTIGRNLSYLEERLNLSVDELRRLVVGYPRVLSLSLESDLMTSIDFFDDALLTPRTGDDSSHGNGNVSSSEDVWEKVQHRSRISSLLCETPSLMEYNVNKRLRPRLERVRMSVPAGKGGGQGSPSGGVDEEMLRSIATLTDSRFESWLRSLHRDETKGTTNGHRHDSADYGNMIVDNDWNVDVQRYPPSTRQPNNPTSYVVVSNLQSGANIGNILRSASIFGCEECIVVGQRRYRLTGEHGSRLDLPRRHMWSHADVKEYLHGKGVRIYGIEIIENATPVMRYDADTGIVHFPFNREYAGSAFIFGNEGNGLSTKQRAICDEFVFVPQQRGGTRVGGGGGSASLNVACAAAVILQAYCMWAGYSSARREGEKFMGY